jgi:hypothetical protein
MLTQCPGSRVVIRRVADDQALIFARAMANLTAFDRL